MVIGNEKGLETRGSSAPDCFRRGMVEGTTLPLSRVHPLIEREARQSAHNA